MALKIEETYVFGGVDSRSNPLNLPRERCLRARNFVPSQGGWLELRLGYSTVTMTQVTATAVHSAVDYLLLSGTHYVLFGIGTGLSRLDLSSGTVTSVGTLTSSNKWNTYRANNRIHLGNGVDMKFYDGTTLRDSGIRAPLAAESTPTTTAIGSADANGVPATVVGGSQPGFQFYMCYYNPTTQHCGNRVTIGSRLAPTTASDINIASLPDISGVNSEWVKLFGRTLDGAEVPYAITDSGGNFITAAAAATTATIATSFLDFSHELPTRNGVAPAMDKFCRVGDKIYGNGPNSASIFRSESAADSRQGIFLGNPEQSWASNNFETFPTGEAVTCIAENDLEVYAFSQNSSAILVDLGGQTQWLGPWDIGGAGQRAFVKTPYGPFWITYDRQLGTQSDTGPIIVSDEYEKSLLSRISYTYLGEAECVYLRDPDSLTDQIITKGRDTNGSPFEIVHDFRLRDQRNPFGQAYERVWAGQLANNYALFRVRDVNGKLRAWAGGNNGQIYQLLSGYNDGGTEFSADFITLVNFGTERPGVPYVEFIGDGNLSISVGKSLKTKLADFVQLPSTQAPGGADYYQFRARIDKPEMRWAYIRIELNSHSADAPVAPAGLVSDAPLNLPIVDYGKCYVARMPIGDTRPH